MRKAKPNLSHQLAASATTRRGVLAGTTTAMIAAGAFLAPAAAAAAENPDAALMAACAEFEAVERRVIEILDGPGAAPNDGEADRLAAPLQAKQFALLDELDALPTHTEGGLRARLRLLSVHNAHGKYSWDGPDTISGRLLRQAMQLGARETPAAGQIAEHPDAELLRLCAEWQQLHAAAYALDDDDEAGITAALELRWELTDRIEGIAPATMSGHAAKAEIAVALLLENASDESGESGDVRIALSTLRHMAGGAA